MATRITTPADVSHSRRGFGKLVVPIFMALVIISALFQLCYHTKVVKEQAARDNKHVESGHLDLDQLYIQQHQLDASTIDTTPDDENIDFDAVEQKPSTCTDGQKKTIRTQLTPLYCRRQKDFPWMHGCSFTVATKCPKQTWIEDYYAQQQLETSINDDPFVGISVGCNKGFDAIETMRMGSSDTRFDKVAWNQALSMGGTVELDESVCKQNRPENQVYVPLNAKVRSNSEMHCIEPMPLTYHVLQRAAHSLNLDSEGFLVNNLAIGKSSGMALFPKAHIGEVDDPNQNHNRVKVGTENKGIESCEILTDEERMGVCQEVPIMTLDDYVSKYVTSAQAEGPIHMLSIDVEGYDFDVLLGGAQTLKRTHYVEFEYNWMGSWKNQHLQDAIHMLDEIGFTCYWAGMKKLWRITDCWMDYYDLHHWSNVACVSRSQAYALAEQMENLFVKTLRTPGLVYYPAFVLEQICRKGSKMPSCNTE